MRMSDRPSAEVEVSVAASPPRVWELIVDLHLMGQWSPEYRGGEWLDGATSPAVGARFKGYNKRRDREWESVSTVIASTPGQVIAWAVGDANNPGASWRFDLVPEGHGTKVRQRVEIGPGPSGLTARIAELPDREEDIITARIAEHRRNMQATLAGLKAAAERGQ